MSEKNEQGAGDAGRPAFVVPVIENIHTKVLEAVKAKPELFNMESWHEEIENTEGNVCGTTHCRAGWVVTLAGEAGKALEEKTSTPFAAMQIYFKSCPAVPVSPVRFYENNEVAMADIERCAKEESAL